MTNRDDLEALDAERLAADRAYNDALTRLDRAIQALPAAFPHPPPAPDENQITPLNALWKIGAPASGGLRGRFVGAVRRAVAPLFEQQQAFNSAVVDHINRNVVTGRHTRESIDSTLTLLRDTIADLIKLQSRLVIFVQQITPYVETKDRSVAGLLRGLSGAIDSIADELLKRTDAMLARDRRHDAQVADVDAQLRSLQQQLHDLQQMVARSGIASASAAPPSQDQGS